MHVVFEGDFEQWMSITFVNDYSSPLHSTESFNIEHASDIINIPDTVKSIPSGTFRNTKITKVILPESVTSIGEEAFENCALLTEIELPESITYIGKNAFKNSGIYKDSENWDNGVLYIGHHLIEANSECSGDYVIEENTKTISPEAFKNCSAETVTLRDTIIWIGANAFDCTALKGIKYQGMPRNYLAFGIIGRGVTLNENLQSGTILSYFKTYYGEWKLY